MHYAVTLEFDKESENKIQQMIDDVAEKTGCNHMKQYGIPPHITVSGIISETEEALLEEVEKISQSMSKDFVWFANIGIFNPLVIYLGPVMNEFLYNACKTVNERLLQYAEVGNKGQYLPDQWVPHTAVAVELTPEGLKEAFSIVQEKFSAFGAVAERITLAKCEPYEKLKSWMLQ